MAKASDVQVAVPGRRVRAWPRISRDHRLRIGALIAILGAWEIVGRNVNPLILPAFSRVVGSLFGFIASGVLLKAWLDTVTLIAVSFAIASLGGVATGLLLGRFETLDRLFEPALRVLYVTPRIAMLPIIIVWFGFGFTAKVMLVVAMIFFEIFLATRDGVRGTDPELVEVARAYSVTDRKLFRLVILPSALPAIMAGLRIGLLHGLVGVVLAGFFLESTGVGGLMLIQSSSLRTAGLIAVILTIAIAGIAVSSGLRRLEHRLAPWHRDPFAAM
jgi:ABC-type nitrate/sulfonate/bicarbonate transport system permease component